MSDLISRQAAIDKLRNNIAYMQAFGCDRAITLIRELPSADVVEVVRCKDCKHYLRTEPVCKLHSNNYAPPVFMNNDDFCNYGERKL